ncbi:hypothetical protein [Mesorhizobium sp.]|uniref:hypothetical protein n=1 Tax=Mesorhizobium sp. TaxID=1871066 RepID=UPI00345BD112
MHRSGLEPAIVGRFIAEAGSPEPLAATVRCDDRVVWFLGRAGPMKRWPSCFGKAAVRVACYELTTCFTIHFRPNVVGRSFL